MEQPSFKIEAITPFSESLIWQLNRDYYETAGIKAWSDNVVPHHLTSNAIIGRTYAELIFALLNDLHQKGNTQETVYLLELGAGHGRLAFHTLQHLQALCEASGAALPPYCYILSDIVEDNLTFFSRHPQFQAFIEQGQLDVAFFDGVSSNEIVLRHSRKTIIKNSLKQPIVAIGNYFFDSIPNELFYIKEQKIAACFLALASDMDPNKMEEEELLDHLQYSYYREQINPPYAQNPIFHQMLEEYQEALEDSYLFFPKQSLECIDRIRQLSSGGLMLLSMDKGFHEMQELDHSKQPEIIQHGSFSIWVNYHAFGAYCDKTGGKALLPAFSTFYVQSACLLFLEDNKSFYHTHAAYQQFVNRYGPDDFTGLIRMAYKQLPRLVLTELIAILRLSAYDSTVFKNILPRFKQMSRKVTVKERNRVAQTLHQVWKAYFNINEPFDLAYEIGGLFYDLAYYQDALAYFAHSERLFGPNAEVYYNQALCYYQLRKDALFFKTLEEAKAHFPDYERFAELERLDMIS